MWRNTICVQALWISEEYILQKFCAFHCHILDQFLHTRKFPEKDKLGFSSKVSGTRRLLAA